VQREGELRADGKNADNNNVAGSRSRCGTAQNAAEQALSPSRCCSIGASKLKQKQDPSSNFFGDVGVVFAAVACGPIRFCNNNGNYDGLKAYQ
jgi:hypothetical protein